MSSDGDLQAASLEGLSGRDLTNTLRSYVRRAREGHDDPALVVGTSKDLMEAAAKHVLASRGVDNPKQQFPRLLEQTFATLDLPTANWDDFKNYRLRLDAGTEWGRVLQSLQVVGRCINDLRNAQGTGHGRIEGSSSTEAQSRIAAEAAALVASLLLDMGDQQAPVGRKA